MSPATYRKIVFVSAGAGSGKTYRLTEILHDELTSGRARPSGVIVTTFAKTAASEIRERVREHLFNRGNFNLASAIGQSWIGTVNSVAGDLIKRFALEIGFSPDQQILDEVQAEIILARAIDAVLDGPGMESLQDAARRLDLEEDWKEDLKSLVDVLRSNDIPVDRVATFGEQNAADLLNYFPIPTSEDLSELLLQTIQERLPLIEAKAESGGKEGTKKYLGLVKDFYRSLQNGTAKWSEWVKLSKEKPEAALRDTIQAIAELSGRFAEHRELQSDLRSYLKQVFELAGQVLKSYAVIKAEIGALDFTDQEHQLLDLLDRADIAGVLEEDLDLLMVDEFQDTSPIQLAIFLKLAGFAKRVFWVGDVKQAIFEFRGSDAKLMNAILENLPELGADKEILRHSWRSRKELVDLANALFSRAFSDSLPLEEVELESKRDGFLKGPAVMNWILGGKNLAQEHSALASGIRRLVESGYSIYEKGTGVIRPVAYKDIAILARIGIHVRDLTMNLSLQGIPVASAQYGLLRTPEAVLALACLSRLNDPKDTVSTAIILSMADGLEPEVWVSDRLKFIQGRGEEDYWMERSTDDRKAHPLLEIIGKLRGVLPVLTPREALESVIATCRLSEVIVRWNPDETRARTRLANLEALIDLANQYEEFCRSGQHAASISGLLLWLSEIGAKEKDNRAMPAVNAVKVLTNHSAKGLEWPVVVLTDLHSAIKDRLWSVSARSESDFRVGDPLLDRYIRYWPWPFGRQKNVSLADNISTKPIATEFRESAIEESKRLLYVSMTRARDLMILARSSRNQTGEWIDTLDAPWLLQDSGGDPLILPSGETIQSERWELGPIVGDDVVAASNSESIFWFPTSGDNTTRLPLTFNPSKAMETPSTILEKCSIGERITVAAGADMEVLGSAIHDCIALSFSDLRVPITETEVKSILGSYAVGGEVSAEDVCKQIEALHDWIKARWPDAVPYAEIPVQSVLENGQILNGRIDLLLETDNGWILIDHKSSRLAPEHWDNLASEYGTQLDAYEKALVQASHKQVVEKWISLPVAGGAMRISNG